jgi:hypothetical protein
MVVAVHWRTEVPKLCCQGTTNAHEPDDVEGADRVDHLHLDEVFQRMRPTVWNEIQGLMQ